MRLRRIIVAVVTVLFVGGAFALGLIAFKTQRDHGTKVVTIGAGKEGIGVDARVIGVDPASTP